MNRFQWSRKLYTLARHALGKLGTTNDLESVQCLIFMVISITVCLSSYGADIAKAKVCQNELNPHCRFHLSRHVMSKLMLRTKVAYMYLGLAVRSSISAGYHRESPTMSKAYTSALSADAASKTWWYVYLLALL